MQLNGRDNRVEELRREYSKNVDNSNIVEIDYLVTVILSYKNRKGYTEQIIQKSKKGTIFDVVVIKSVGYSEEVSIYIVKKDNIKLRNR